MSEIVKTKAVVLKKIDYGESSKIATFYTEGHGKISAIIKGAKSPKSKLGSIIDIVNLLDLVYYQKAGRDLQIVGQAGLIEHYPKIKADYDKLKFALAIAEVTLTLTLEGEINRKLFSGLERILNILESGGLRPNIALLKYLVFLISELGYELQGEFCHNCGKKLTDANRIGFSFEFGFFCEDCMGNGNISHQFSKELFNFFSCLKGRSDCSMYGAELGEKLLKILEKYIVYHIPDFKGITSLKIY